MKFSATKLSFALAGAAYAMTMATPASAASFIGLYDTGVDNNGNVIAAGSVDSHYTIQATTDATVPAPTSAFVTNPNPSWSANSAVGSNGSAWITYALDRNNMPAVKPFPTLNTYDYVLTFTLDGIAAADALLSGRVQSDNYVEVFLNGTKIGGQAPVASPGSVSYFTDFTAFGSGGATFNQNSANTLTFRVTDYGVVSGLRVDNLVGTAVPEPGVWAMLIVGFGLVAGQIRRRRRMGPVALA